MYKDRSQGMNENTQRAEQDELDEIVSLNIDDLDVNELERRFELSIAMGLTPECCGTNSCGTFSCVDDPVYG
jgi:hypothetical protein